MESTKVKEIALSSIDAATAIERAAPEGGRPLQEC